MTLWSTKGMGVMFGGVTDEDTSEETLESVFHQDLLVTLFLLPNIEAPNIFQERVPHRNRKVVVYDAQATEKARRSCKKKEISS